MWVTVLVQMLKIILPLDLGQFIEKQMRARLFA